MKRITATLLWNSNDGNPLCAVSDHSVNLGNPTIAWMWTIAVTLVVLALLVLLARAGAGSPVRLLCADDGHLSLALTQIALWTIVVAAVTFFYGMIRLQVPTIPDSVLILMGLSLAAGGLGASAAPQKSRTGTVDSAPLPKDSDTKPKSPKLYDLILLYPQSGPPQPSLARAQMLFWTLLIIVLFVSKSAIDGVLWDVPAGLVALMGVSQAGYVGPKFFGPYAGDSGDAGNTQPQANPVLPDKPG